MSLPWLPPRFHSFWGSELQEGNGIYPGFGVRRFSVRPPVTEFPIVYLSVAINKKVILARWLLFGPKVVVLAEPNEGNLMWAPRARYTASCKISGEKGMGVLMISSEMPGYWESQTAFWSCFRGDFWCAEPTQGGRRRRDCSCCLHRSSHGHGGESMTGKEADLQPVVEAQLSRAGFVRAPSIGRVLGALIGLVLVILFLGIAEPSFMTWGNIMNIFRLSPTTFILAIGMTFVILTGGLALSVASSHRFRRNGAGFLYQGGVGRSRHAHYRDNRSGAGPHQWFSHRHRSDILLCGDFATLSIYASVILVLTRGSTISLFAYETFNPIAHIKLMRTWVPSQ